MFNIDPATLSRKTLKVVKTIGVLIFLFATTSAFTNAQVETPDHSEISSKQLLPATTKGWLSIPRAKELKESVERSQFGKLLNDPDLKPWVADLKTQAVELLNKNNVRLGLEFADLEVIETGEIAIATVLDPGETSYAIVLLVNVKGAKEETEALLKKIAARLQDRGAEKTEKKFQETNYNEWKFPPPQGGSWRKQQFAFNAVVEDWLVMTDQESVCRELLRRIVTPSADDVDILAANETFSAIQQKLQPASQLHNAQINWFIEPWGYLKIANMIAEERQKIHQPAKGHDRIYRDEGFDAIKGVGGWLSISTDKYELVHQSYIYAPPTVEGINKYLKAAAILDFSNPDEDDLDPLPWMPNEVSSLTSMTWDLNKVVNNVGSLIESMMGSEGSYQNMLDAFEEDMKLEKPVKELVASLGRRINLITDIEMPIDERSERVLISIKIDKDDSLIRSTIEKFIGETELVIEEHKGHRIAVVDLTKKDEGIPPELQIDPLGVGDPLQQGGGDKKEKEKEKGLKPIFEKRVICVAYNHVLISNNVDYMKKLLDKSAENRGELLKTANDYQRIQMALNELDARNSSIKHFGRIDRSVRVNYEMMRQGKMDSSQTMLAQLLEQFTPKNELGISNRQKLDVEKMPADFEKSVAKYLGLTGWKMITEQDGWSVVGCILPKMPEAEVSQENSSVGSSDDKTDDATIDSEDKHTSEAIQTEDKR